MHRILSGAFGLVVFVLPVNGQTQETPPSLPHLDIGDSQTFRSYDGTGNNLLNPDWGSTNTPYLRLLDADYVDGSTPSGADRPSAREISNAVSLQSGDMPSDKNLNALFWSFGQLLAHDITLTPAASPTEYFNIPVSDDDDYFGMVDYLPLRRSSYDHATGTDAGNPRQQINAITAFIDASFVYGSDPVTANILRSNNGTGRLVTGPGNMLPTNGQLGLDGDPGNDFLFVAGDERANEQLALSAMHTIFMREHNRLAGLIAADNPGMGGDEVFQMTRMIVGAEMQAITYNEFLPILLGEENGLADYAGYSASVDPAISNEFAAAAYRLGHTLLQNDFLIIGPDGPVENLALASCFFNPSCMNTEGLEATIFGLAQQDAQVFDTMFVDAVRNNLITDFGITMLVDLSANNIQRGRDHGLPSYQSTVAQLQALGLLAGDGGLPGDVLDAYGASEVDLIIGGLAETPHGDALVGEVFHAFMLDQFGRLRDGDRFWYQQNALFDDDMILWLDDLTLADLILWNTDLEFLQAYGFFTVDFGLGRAATQNQYTTASYLNALTTANVDAYDLYLIGIHIGASDDIPRALDMLHPEWFNAFTETGLVHARSGMNEVTRRIGMALGGADAVAARRANNGTSAGSSGDRQPLAFWINGGVEWQDVDPKNGYMGFESTTSNVWMGVDYLASQTVLVGMMAGVSDTDIDYDNRTGDGDAKSWQVSAFAAVETGRWHLMAQGGLGDMDVQSSRDIDLDSYSKTAIADYDGSLSYGRALASYRLSTGGGWQIRPTASLTYVRIKQDAFQESGADFANLTVMEQSHASLRAAGLVHFSKVFDRASGRVWQPFFQVGIAHEFKDNPREISASLGGAGFGFTVLGAVAAQTTAVVGAGVDVQLGQSFWLNLNWRSDIGSHYADHSVQAGALLQF